jgi:hypothetical protein
VRLGRRRHSSTGARRLGQSGVSTSSCGFLTDARSQPMRDIRRGHVICSHCRAKGRRFCGILPRETPVITFPRVVLRVEERAGLGRCRDHSGRPDRRAQVRRLWIQHAPAVARSPQRGARRVRRAAGRPGATVSDARAAACGVAEASVSLPAQGLSASAPPWPCRYHAARDRVRLGMRHQSIKRRDARRRGTVAASPSLPGERAA